MRPTLLRHHQRQALRRCVRVECQVVREHDFKLIGTSAIDLSAHGMLVETNDRVLTGEVVIIAFRSPRRRAWYDALATVARVIHGRRPYDTGRLLGIRFDELDERQACALREDLRGLPPPFPKRELRIDYAASVRQFLTH